MEQFGNERTGIFGRFPRTFWVANSIELFERWAWYGFYMLFANYLTGTFEEGGLQFSQADKGIIMGVGTAILYFLPVLTGSIADKYGYKKVLIIAFIVYISAFIGMPLFKSFGGVFFIYLYLALGAALFKPIVSATVAKTTNDKTSSIGFGIFYMMVNIGGYFGPMLTLIFKGDPKLVFYICAGFIALNFIMLFFYKEPDAERLPKTSLRLILDLLFTLIFSILLFVSVFAIFLAIWVIELPVFFINYGEKLSARWSKLILGLPIGDANKKVFENITGVFFESKFITFLIIVAGFWAMYNQLYYTLPVFIDQWVDTSAMFHFFEKNIPFIASNYGTGGGQIQAEFITTFDALYIIIFQIMVSALLMRLKPLHTMMIGFLVCSIGMSLTLVSQNPVFILVALLVFALGEMAGSPKITEYIGRIAPEDKKGVYMGYSFIPVFLGNLFAGIISGAVYQAMSDKTSFVQLEAKELGVSLNNNMTINESFNLVAGKLNMSSGEFTHHLWNKYHPSGIWIVILGIGMVSVIALFIYNKLAFRSNSR